MEVFCPKCSFTIKLKDINISKNICFCQNCNDKFNLFNAIYKKKKHNINEMLKNPPKGIFIKNKNEKLIIKILLFDKEVLPLYFFIIIPIIPIIGFIGSFIIYRNINVLIEWLIFLIPGIIFFILFLFKIFGKIDFIFNKNMYIFTGIGIIGKKKIINWDYIKKIYEVDLPYDKDDIKNYLYIEEHITHIIKLHYISKLKIEYLIYVLKYLLNYKLLDIIKQKYVA